MGKFSRNKGAEFERTVAKALFAETGITFRRNLAQTQERALGDLTPDNDAWPFLIECKNIANTINCATAWELQAHEAAKKADRIWCVIYKVRGGAIRCRIPLTALYQACGGFTVTHLATEMDIQTLAYVAREIMHGQGDH